MRNLFTISFLILIVHSSLGQDQTGFKDKIMMDLEDTTYWNNEFQVGINFNQAAFSGNWKSGGVNSIAFGSVLAAKANYAKKRWSWDNQLELVYGIVKNEGQEIRKANDRIFIDSKVGYKTSEHWGLFLSPVFFTCIFD
jgi:hypothetical protein